MSKAGHLAWVAGACVACALWGCGANEAAPKGYFGPTLGLADLVAKVNRNNDQLPTLWRGTNSRRRWSIRRRTSRNT